MWKIGVSTVLLSVMVCPFHMSRDCTSPRIKDQLATVIIIVGFIYTIIFLSFPMTILTIIIAIVIVTIIVRIVVVLAVVGVFFQFYKNNVLL